MNVLTRTDFLKKELIVIYKEHNKYEIKFLINKCIQELEEYNLIYLKKNFIDSSKAKESIRLIEMDKRVLAKYFKLTQSYGYYYYNNCWMEDLPK